MTDSKKRYLQVPQGTEGFHLEEAYRHRKITHELLTLFDLWGYLPVETPVFDFYDIYRPLLQGSSRDVYRLIDRDGDLLMLRSDITLFLVKQMGLWLQESDLPSRVCYADTILRHQNAEDISRNEFFQIGAELIGKAGMEADLEVLLLLEAVFDRLDISPAIHIGSHQFLTTGLQDFGEEELSEAVQAIRNRDFNELEKVLSGRYSARRVEALLSVFSFIGDSEEFLRLIGEYGGVLHNEELEDLHYLVTLVEKMGELGYGDSIRIDMSEIGAQPYYTGIVFQVYLDGMDDAVASGGRYDKLLDRFGFDCPSVGFSMMLRKIEDQADSKYGERPAATQIQKDDFLEAFRTAEELRKKGEIALL